MSASFRSLAENYPVIFFDAYGVLKNFEGVIDGVIDTLAALRKDGKQLFLVTNDASRSPQKMSESYVHPELGEIFGEERIISSGLLASDFLRLKVRAEHVAYLGKKDSAHYIRAAGRTPVRLADVTREHDLGAVALLDDEGFDWQPDINRAINLLREHPLPVVVANADQVYPVQRNAVAVAAGGIADLIEGIVHRRFVRFGKPDAYMFSYTFARAASMYPGLRRRDILMVGDTLETDIRGGNKFGIDTLLVLTGNTAPGSVDLEVKASGISPDFVCDTLT